MSILATKTEQRAKEILAKCISLFQQLANLEMTAEDAFEARKAESLLHFIINGFENEPDDCITIDSLTIERDEMYVLVRWPDVQDLMGYEWFREDCYLHNAFEDQKYLSSAYFVPLNRIIQINQPG